jgi:mRNA interferase RelE/StbE
LSAAPYPELQSPGPTALWTNSTGVAVSGIKVCLLDIVRIDSRFVTRGIAKELAQNPYLGKELQAELSGFWSYRFQRYRIVFKADTQKKIIIVWAIGHRRDIYETMSEHVLSFSPEESE